MPMYHVEGTAHLVATIDDYVEAATEREARDLITQWIRDDHGASSVNEIAIQSVSEITTAPVGKS